MSPIAVRRRVCGAALAMVLLAVLIAASPAFSATAEPVEGVLYYTAAPGELNDVVIGRTKFGLLSVEDRGRQAASGDPIDIGAGSGCTGFDPSRVVCAAEGISALQVDAGDGAVNRVRIVVDLATTLIGGEGGDRLTGGPLADVISGGGGDDALTGSTGSNSVEGLAADPAPDDDDDAFTDSTGSNSAEGLVAVPAPGDDDRDTIDGGSGDDRVLGGVGDDVLTGGPGRDSVEGGEGDDELFTADDAGDESDCGSGTDTATVDDRDRTLTNCERIQSPTPDPARAPTTGAAPPNTFTVPPTTPPTGPARLPLLQPVPIVRVAGSLTLAGARIRLLQVTAPRGARLLARCRGRGCPFRRSVTTVVRRSSSKSVLKIRLRQLERPLGAGTVVEIAVSRQGTIGKFTRISIRKGKPPRRMDACVRHRGHKPIDCPA